MQARTGKISNFRDVAVRAEFSRDGSCERAEVSGGEDRNSPLAEERAVSGI